MKFEHRVVVEAPETAVRALLDDFPRAAGCLPGLEEVKELEDGTYEGRMGIRIGPLGMHFSGKGRLERVDEQTWRMHGEGRDRRVGAGVTAAVDAKLAPVDAQTTEVLINADVQFSGRLAELGQPLIKRKADAMVQEFAENLKKVLRS